MKLFLYYSPLAEISAAGLFILAYRSSAPAQSPPDMSGQGWNRARSELEQPAKHPRSSQCHLSEQFHCSGCRSRSDGLVTDWVGAWELGWEGPLESRRRAG